MISFRYHVVSIVAFFLALALGILIGTGAVNQEVVATLKARTDALTKSNDDLRTQVTEWRRFGAVIEPYLVADKLTDQRVVMVTAQGVDPAEVDAVQTVLGDAGANVEAVIVATAKMGLKQESARTQLATLLGVSDALPPYRLSETAAESLGRRLQRGSEAATSQDFLEQMGSAGFLDVQEHGGARIQDLGGPGEVFVVLEGGTSAPVVDPSLFAVPLVNSLVDRGEAVGVGETSDTTYPFVALIRDDKDRDGKLVTVDNADQTSGQIAVVLGLANMLQPGGQGGDYGVKGGATGLIPAS